MVPINGHLLAVCLLWVNGHLTQGKISDACHGQTGVNLTHNILECEKGSQICITEVRFYTSLSNCPNYAFTFTPLTPQCCLHDPNQCSATKSPEPYQAICSGRQRCSLQSSEVLVITTPCPNDYRTLTSVRSITYTCSATGSCSLRTESTKKRTGVVRGTSGTTSTGQLPGTPTIPEVQASPDSPQPVDYTWVIVGCVVGVVAVAALITTVILFRRRRPEQPPGSSPNVTTTAKPSVTNTAPTGVYPLPTPNALHGAYSNGDGVTAPSAPPLASIGSPPPLTAPYLTPVTTQYLIPVTTQQEGAYMYISSSGTHSGHGHPNNDVNPSVCDDIQADRDEGYIEVQ